MTPYARLTIGATLVLAFSAPAIAGDLVTPMVYVGNSSVVHCKALNITTSAVELDDIIIMDANTNMAIVSSGATTIAPGEWGDNLVNNPGAQLYCRFVGANKKKVRASLNVHQSDGIDGSDTTVLIAQ